MPLRSDALERLHTILVVSGDGAFTILLSLELIAARLLGVLIKLFDGGRRHELSPVRRVRAVSAATPPVLQALGHLFDTMLDTPGRVVLALHLHLLHELGQ